MFRPIAYPGDDYVNARRPIPYPGDDYVNARSPNQAMAHYAKYAADDWAHRHRLQDEDAKTVQVTPHARRLPRKQEVQTARV